MVGGVVADVHPGAVELADLVVRQEARLGHPAGDHEERGDHVPALEVGQDRPDVVDVAVVDRDQHRLGRQRLALVQGVEQLGLADRVVAAVVQRLELGREVGGIDDQVGLADRGHRVHAVVGQHRHVHGSHRGARGRLEDRHRSPERRACVCLRTRRSSWRAAAAERGRRAAAAASASHERRREKQRRDGTDQRDQRTAPKPSGQWAGLRRRLRVFRERLGTLRGMADAPQRSANAC